jgi:DNA-binding NarL/FixJ family response regulator
MGFIPKTASRDALLNAVRLVASGGIFVPVEALNARPAASARPEPSAPVLNDRGAGPIPVSNVTAASLGLTPRQGEVLALLLKGLPNKLIARRLDISDGTVKVHVSAVLQTLGVATRTQALIAATRLGLRLE